MAYPCNEPPVEVARAGGHPLGLRGSLRAFALASVVCLVAALPARAVDDEEVLPSDPRVIEANALLSEDGPHPRAIELYRQVIAERPDDAMARMWLARVLAWDGRYDESLAHYNYFLTRPDPPNWVAVERAEVLSWAGHYDEAEAAFRALIQADPADARAARGLARVLEWAGRRAEAVVAYERALALEDDTEAEREFARLRSQLAGGGEIGSDYSEDSDGFRARSLRAAVDLDWSFRTVLLARGSYIWLDGDQPGNESLPSELRRPESTEAFDIRVGLEHRFGRNLVVRTLVGGRRWQDARSFFVARGEAEYTVSDRLVTGLLIDHGDFLERAHSLDAVLDGIQDTTVRGWAWAGLHSRVESFSYFEASFLGDGNRRYAGGASIDYSPWRNLSLTFSPAFDLLGYTENSDAYWDPDISAEGSLGTIAKLPLCEVANLALGVGVGWGYARQDGSSSHGFAYLLSGGPELELGSWRLSAEANRSSSIRATTYTSWGVGVTVGRGF